MPASGAKTRASDSAVQRQRENGTLVGLLTIGLAPTNGTTGTLLLQTVDQLVAKTLVVSFTMIMGDVVGERSSKMPFTDRNGAVETFLFD